MGDIGDLRYVDMAAAILKLVNDQDSKPKTTTHDYWNNEKIIRHYDAFANYPVFHQILFRNSNRYTSTTGICWQVKNNDPEPNRTEAYPELWDQKPELAFNLLQHSLCELVHEFACKILKQHQKFCLTLPLSAWKAVLLNPYPISANFALEFVQKHHPNIDDLNFIIACLEAPVNEIREAAKIWLKNVSEDKLLEDSNWLCKLTLSEHDNIRQLSRLYHKIFQQHPDKHPAIEIQGLGIELLGTIDEAELLTMSETLVELLLSDHNLIRQNARKIIQRVANNDDMFAKAVLRLIPFIFWKEKSEGLHEILIACISTDLKNTWSTIDDNLRILDTKWDDSRNFAIEFYRNKFEAADWTTNRVIYSCSRKAGKYITIKTLFCISFIQRQQRANCQRSRIKIFNYRSSKKQTSSAIICRIIRQ